MEEFLADQARDFEHWLIETNFSLKSDSRTSFRNAISDMDGAISGQALRSMKRKSIKLLIIKFILKLDLHDEKDKRKAPKSVSTLRPPSPPSPSLRPPASQASSSSASSTIQNRRVCSASPEFSSYFLSVPALKKRRDFKHRRLQVDVKNSVVIQPWDYRTGTLIDQIAHRLFPLDSIRLIDS
ncbi:hypothetical protein L2E82_19650 [Cichorium intybus]|uniref:Uncharacterized protein n=1 Tax=Cichorium intybus TaxID=13427 RepID=A0ACB9FD67_CICIN|nr:hypothetical protein L2E82_19650 [Cichorium intybus]